MLTYLISHQNFLYSLFHQLNHHRTVISLRLCLVCFPICQYLGVVLSVHVLSMDCCTQPGPVYTMRHFVKQTSVYINSIVVQFRRIGIRGVTTTQFPSPLRQNHSVRQV